MNCNTHTHTHTHTHTSNKTTKNKKERLKNFKGNILTFRQINFPSITVDNKVSKFDTILKKRKKILRRNETDNSAPSSSTIPCF